MALVEVVENQNVVARVASLPLISSAYVMVSNVYCNTKDNHPYIKSVCEVAEMGVKTITSAALSSAQPIIGKLEPQIAIANDLACKGLDKIEMTLPILQQPSGQIIASAKEAVTGAKDAVSVTVSGAKDAVSHTLTGVMDRTRGAVQGSVEMTRAVVSEGVRLVSSGMDTALTTSEGLVEQYLPRSEEELEKEVKMMKGSDGDAPSYYVRLGSLSSTLRQRAYQRAVGKVRDAKQRSQESISQLSHTVDMIEFARKNIDGASQTIHEKLSSLVEWTTGQKNGENGDGHEAEQIESRTLAIARRLTQQLQTTCLGLASSLQGLPQHVQDQALSVSSSAVEVYASFSKASAFGDLPDTVLTSSRAQLSKMKDSLDDVMDYLVNNTPLNWLVPDFTFSDLASEPDMSSAEDHDMSSDPSKDLKMDAVIDQ